MMDSTLSVLSTLVVITSFADVTTKDIWNRHSRGERAATAQRTVGKYR
jgi:hypothetical protein